MKPMDDCAPERNPDPNPGLYQKPSSDGSRSIPYASDAYQRGDGRPSGAELGKHRSGPGRLRDRDLDA